MMNNTSEFYARLSERLLGGVIFVIFLMVAGLIGNVHILFVYAFRVKASNHRVFILFLGALDFLACCVAMPFTVVCLLQPELFGKDPTCKLYWFVNYFICSASGLALLVIAMERYRKICVPLGWQLTRRLAVMSCFIVIFITTLCSWPVLILIGTTTVPSHTPRITDSICATVDNKLYRSYQIYYHIILSLLVLPCFVALIVLYTLIWRVVRKYAISRSYVKEDSASMILFKKRLRKSSISGENEASEMKSNSDSEKYSLSSRSNENTSDDCRKYVRSLENTSENSRKYVRSRENTSENSRKYVRSRENTSSNSRKYVKSRKTILAFILITVVFFISYIPYLTITILIYTDTITYLTPGEVIFINIIRFTPYINNMANVFIYGCFDVKFRCEVWKLWQSCCPC